MRSLLLLLFSWQGTSRSLLLPFWKGTDKPSVDGVVLLRVPIGHQFPVQLRDRGKALFPSFDELRKIGINTSGARAGLLFRKCAMAQPARNSRMTDPYLPSNSGLREPLLTQGDHLLILSQARLSFCPTHHNVLRKHLWRFLRLQSRDGLGSGCLRLTF